MSIDELTRGDGNEIMPHKHGLDAQTIHGNLDSIIEEHFNHHPFTTQISGDNLRGVLADYATMSQLFPYIQAKAIGDVGMNAARVRNRISNAIEVTTAVCAFLVSDETGVYNIACSEGNPGLEKILQTGKNFHFQFLMQDIQRIIGAYIEPSYSEETMRYMEELLADLSSQDDVKRCATMVGFEAHAERMITALWERISEICPEINKDELIYFRTHVGGEDPAEPYHVAMTSGMVETTVPIERRAEFLAEFKKAYQLNFDWCKSISSK